MISEGQKGVKNVFLWAVNTIMLYLGPNEVTGLKKQPGHCATLHYHYCKHVKRIECQIYFEKFQCYIYYNYIE